MNDNLKNFEIPNPINSTEAHERTENFRKSHANQILNRIFDSIRNAADNGYGYLTFEHDRPIPVSIIESLINDYGYCVTSNDTGTLLTVEWE